MSWQTPPGEALNIVTIAPDHTCRFIPLSTATGRPFRPCLVGHWRLTKGVLVFDWNDGLIARIRGHLPEKWGGITLDCLTVESITENKLITRKQNGEPAILLRAEEDPVEEMKNPLPNRPWHTSDG